MTLKHTPSPWIHDHSEIIDGKCSRVCRFADYGAPSPEDMSVILAAPDMLRLLRVFAVPMTQLRRLSDGELRAALEETAELVSRLDGDT